MGDRKSAILSFNQAAAPADLARQGKGDWTLPYQLYSSACMNDDTMSLAWATLGGTLDDMQLSAAALAAHRRATELPPGNIAGDMNDKDRARSMVQIAYRLYVLGRTDEADHAIEEALGLDNMVPQAWCVRSLVYSIMGSHELAIGAARQGLELDPTNATIETALGLNLLFNGDLAEGLRHFEARYRYKLKHFLTFPYPQWHGEAGQTVFLVADQGLGDTLSFARFLPGSGQARRKFSVRWRAEGTGPAVQGLVPAHPQY